MGNCHTDAMGRHPSADKNLTGKGGQEETARPRFTILRDQRAPMNKSSNVVRLRSMGWIAP